MRNTIAVVATVAVGLAGCVRTQVHAEHPAVLEADSASRAALRSAVEKAVGGPVTLADDALTKESALLIEPVPATAGGQRIDGREMRPPVHFTLLISEGKCVLVHEGGKRAELRGARCHAR